MIDIHSHILPGIDDGAHDLDESLAMARLAVEGGTTVMIATPHVSTRQELRRVPEIGDRVAELQTALDAADIPLRLVGGAEVYPMDGILEAIDAGLSLALGGGRYLLLDSPLTALPMGLGKLIFDLQTRGLRPILAHPERVGPVQQNPQVLEDLVQRGLLLQVNGASLLGRNGDEAEVAARRLLEHRWVHVVASDAHGARSRRPGLAAARREMAAILPEEEVATLLEKNPQRILVGEMVPSDPLAYTPPGSQRKWWHWFGLGR